MKIAICLSGAPRFKHNGMFRFLNSLKGFDQADFFIRTWKSNEFGNTADEFVNYLKSNGLDDKKYNFKVVEVLEENYENAPPKIGPLNLIDSAINLLPMWWGIVKCYELYKTYVERTNEKYDLVLRMRTDSPSDREIDLSLYTDPNKMYAGGHHIHNCTFTDSFLFGTPRMYEKFIGYWDALDYYVRTQDSVHPENSIREYFDRSGIQYEVIPAFVHPERDYDEYSVRVKNEIYST